MAEWSHRMALRSVRSRRWHCLRAIEREYNLFHALRERRMTRRKGVAQTGTIGSAHRIVRAIVVIIVSHLLHGCVNRHSRFPFRFANLTAAHTVKCSRNPSRHQRDNVCARLRSSIALKDLQTFVEWEGCGTDLVAVPLLAPRAGRWHRYFECRCRVARAMRRRL